eukprot:TRINITY_DN11645_c0_g1_i2.p1 TRINITY_DN11645_c0_g1~~TRINITY_DN11645_c0_g1_i2.p1  ORF type:complete len:632 (-),score=192.54 TRINITY_DN11645_c0_g1_i2:34-1929(-)
MEDIRIQLETNVDELAKLEISLAETAQKLDEIVQRVVQNEGEYNRREETKILWEIEDLEKIEQELEGKYQKTRGSLMALRQQLRRKVFEKQDKKEDQKLILSTLLNSTFGGNSLRSSSSRGYISPRSPDVSHRDVNSDDFVVSQWLLSPKDLEYDRSSKPLGSGAFGDVFRGRLRGKEVAIKKLVFQELDEATMADFKKEVAVMARLRHPNVILFMGACTSPGNLAMVVELMPKGSVFDRLRDDKIKLTLTTRMMFAKDTALGMACLHAMTPPLLHLDLKSHNLLIDDNWTAKVCDFGLSQIKKSSKETAKVGSPLYMAPEMLLDQGYDEKADVYSFGILLWELLTCEEPYRGAFKTFEEMLEAVTKRGRRPDIPDDCPPKLRELMQACWNPSATNRPSFKKILVSHTLDDIILESAIGAKNELGRQFWKETFRAQAVVDWKDFIVAFSAKIGAPSATDPENIQLLCLKELVSRKSKQGKEEVTLDDFGKMLEWFGPLEKGTLVLRKIENQLRMKGFFGPIETAEAEKMLNGKKAGSYIVRFSTRDPGCYAVTVLSKAGVLKHYRISHKAGGKYVLGTNEYDSLEELIKAHRKDLYLKTPVLGSKYEAMFTANDKRLATQGYMDTSRIGGK